MNNNDLIRRRDATAHPFANGQYDHDNANKDFIRGCESYKEWLEDLPAVEQPMSAVEYERAKRRFSDWCASTLCSECSFFDDCPHSTPDVVRELTPEQYVATIQKWAQEHHERSKQ